MRKNFLSSFLAAAVFSAVITVGVFWNDIGRARGAERISSESKWQLIGPGGGGRLTSITEDPSNPNNLYATINVGGARRSRDGGNTWEIINRGFTYDRLGKNAQDMADIWVHPTHSNLVLAAGLNGHIYSIDTSQSSEWKLIYTHPKQVAYGKIVSDPANPNIAYVGVGSIQSLILGVGAQRSGNFWPGIRHSPTILRLQWDGSKWNIIEVGAITGTPRGSKGKYLNIYSIAVNPENPKEMFFVTERGLFKGTRDGQEKISKFQPIISGLPPVDDFHGGKVVFTKDGARAYLTVLNLCPNPVLGNICRDKRADRGGVFRSTNGGMTWQELTSENRGLDNTNSNYFDIALDLGNENTIYLAQTVLNLKVSDGTLFRSDDRGETWSNRIDKTKFNSGWEPMKQYGPDFVAPSKFSSNVYWTIGGGKLFKGDDSDDAPPLWTNVLTKGIGRDEWTTTGSEAIALAWSIAVDPKNSDIVYLPYGDHSYFKSMNGGDSMKVLTKFNDFKKMYDTRGDSGSLIIDELGSNRIYAATQGPHQQLKDGGVMYSKNGGVSWNTVGGAVSGDTRGLARGAMTDLLVEYSGTQRNLYAASYGNKGPGGGVYMLKDVDSANSWVEIFTNQDFTHAIAARDNFTVLYIGVDKGAAVPGLYKMEKVKGRWEVTKGPINVGGSAIFYDMETGSTTGAIYIATDKGLFSVDRNDQVTLMKSFATPSHSAVEVHPKNENLIYLAYDSGEVLRSTDRGVVWTEISRDIPTQGFVVLKVDPLVDTVYVESPGGGIWKKSFEEERVRP